MINSSIDIQMTWKTKTDLDIYYSDSITDFFFQNAIKDSYVEKTRIYRLDNNPNTKICFGLASAVITYIETLKLSSYLSDKSFTKESKYLIHYVDELRKDILVDFIAEMLLKYTISSNDIGNQIDNWNNIESNIDYITRKCLRMWLETNFNDIQPRTKQKNILLSVGVKDYLENTLQTNICIQKYESMFYHPPSTSEVMEQLKNYRMIYQINKITEAVSDTLQDISFNQAVEFIAEAIYSIAFKKSNADQHIRSYPIYMKDIDSSYSAIVCSIKTMVALSNNKTSVYYNTEYGTDMNSDTSMLN